MNLTQLEREHIAREAKKNKAEIDHTLRLVEAIAYADELIALNRAIAISDAVMEARRKQEEVERFERLKKR